MTKTMAMRITNNDDNNNNNNKSRKNMNCMLWYSLVWCVVDAIPLALLLLWPYVGFLRNFTRPANPVPLGSLQAENPRLKAEGHEQHLNSASHKPH